MEGVSSVGAVYPFQVPGCLWDPEQPGLWLPVTCMPPERDEKEVKVSTESVISQESLTGWIVLSSLKATMQAPQFVSFF